MEGKNALRILRAFLVAAPAAEVGRPDAASSARNDRKGWGTAVPTTVAASIFARPLCAALVAAAAAAALFAGSAEARNKSAALCSAENNAAFIEQYGGRTVIDKPAFYQAARESFSRYTREGRHFAGTDAIIDEWNENYALEDTRMLAYILATAWHETGQRMYPIREAFADTDEEAIRALDKYFANRTRNIYWRPVEETGRAYFGRGYVQLTWDTNYKKADQYLGIDPEAEDFKERSYYWEPDNALDERSSIRITYSGMFRGWYTTYCLLNFFPPNQKADWAGARRIINGVDKKEKIAGEAVAFQNILQTAGVAVPATDFAERQRRDAEEAAAQAQAEQEAAEARKEEQLTRLALQETNERLRTAEEKIINLETTLGAVAAALAKLEASTTEQAVALREADDDQQFEIDALGDANVALRNEVQLLRAFLTSESKRVTELRRQNAELQKALVTTNASIEDQRQAARAAQDRIEALGDAVKLANSRTLWDFIFGSPGVATDEP